MVEIHGHGLLAYFAYGALNDLPCGIEHRDGASELQKVPADFTVDGESLYRQVEYILRIVNSVSFFRRKHECKIISLLLSFQFLFETRKEHTCAVDVLQRLFGHRLVCKAAVNNKFVADCYN